MLESQRNHASRQTELMSVIDPKVSAHYILVRLIRIRSTVPLNILVWGNCHVQYIHLQ